MKLVIAIVQDDDVHKLASSLRDNGYSLTKLASTGGFLSSGNTTIIVGIDDNQVDDVISIIKEVCKTKKKVTASTPPSSCCSAGGYIPHTIEVTVGGAVVFVVDVDKFEKI